MMLGALLATLVAGRALACSQCLCGSPTPPGYLLGNLSGRFSFGLEERMLSKANGLEDESGEERQIEHRISPLVLFRPTPRVALQARLPYVVKRLTTTVAGAPEEIERSQGLGDGDVLARVDALRFGNRLTRGGSLAVVASASVPTGSNDKKGADGERLEAHLQPGTGAWSGGGGLAFDLALPSSALTASVLVRANGTNSHDYRYGTAVLFNAGYARSLSGPWQVALELNGRTAKRDHTEDGTEDPNSGGTVAYAAPSVRWAGLGPVALDAAVQIPVAQSLHGDQTEKTTARLSFLWSGR
jgi:hypothetical protein